MGAAKDSLNVKASLHPLRYVLFGLAVMCSLFCMYVILDFQNSSEAKLSGELILGKVDTAAYPEANAPLLAFFFEYLGLMCYGVCLVLPYAAYYAFLKKFSIWMIDFYQLSLRVLGFNLLLLGLSGFFSRFALLKETGAGGLLGDMINIACNIYLMPFFTLVVLILLTYFGACLFFGVGPFALFDKVGEQLTSLVYGKKPEEPVVEENEDDLDDDLEEEEYELTKDGFRTSVMIDSRGNEIIGGVDFDAHGNVIDKHGKIITDPERLHATHKVRKKSEIAKEKARRAERARKKAEAEALAKSQANQDAQNNALAQDKGALADGSLQQAQDKVGLDTSVAQDNTNFQSEAKLGAVAQGAGSALAQGGLDAQAMLHGAAQDTPYGQGQPYAAEQGQQYGADSQQYAPEQGQPYATNPEQQYAAGQPNYAQNDMPYAQGGDQSYMQGGEPSYAQGNAMQYGAAQDTPYGKSQPYAAEQGQQYGADGQPYAAEQQYAEAGQQYAPEQGQPYATNPEQPYAAGQPNYAQNDMPYAQGGELPYAQGGDQPYMQGGEPSYAQGNAMQYGAAQDTPYGQGQSYATEQGQQYGAAGQPYAAGQPNYAQNDMPYAQGGELPYAQGEGQSYVQGGESSYAQDGVQYNASQTGGETDYSELMAQASGQAEHNLAMVGTVAQALAQSQAQEAALAQEAAQNPNVNAEQAGQKLEADNTTSPSTLIMTASTQVEPQSHSLMPSDFNQRTGQSQTTRIYGTATAQNDDKSAYQAQQDYSNASQDNNAQQGLDATQGYKPEIGANLSETTANLEQDSDASPFHNASQQGATYNSPASELSGQRGHGANLSLEATKPSDLAQGTLASEQGLANAQGIASEQGIANGQGLANAQSAMQAHDVALGEQAAYGSEQAVYTGEQDTTGNQNATKAQQRGVEEQDAYAKEQSAYANTNEQDAYAHAKAQASRVNELAPRASEQDPYVAAQNKLERAQAAMGQVDKASEQDTQSTSQSPLEHEHEQELTAGETKLSTSATPSEDESESQAANAQTSDESERENIYISPGVAKQKKRERASSVSESESPADSGEVHTIIQKVDPEVFAAQQAAARAAQEAKLKAEQAEAERKAKEEAERKAKEEQEAREKAEAEAKAEAERKAKEEAEAQAKAEAEAKAKAEQEARDKAEAEAKAKAEAEAKAKEEQEASPYMGTYADKLKRKQKKKAKDSTKSTNATENASDEQDDNAPHTAITGSLSSSDNNAEVKPQTEATNSVDTVVTRSSAALTPAPVTSVIPDNQFAAINAAREKAEAERKAKEEAERKAKEEAEAKAKAEAEAKAKAEAAAKAKAEQEARDKAEAEAKAKAEAEAKAKAEAEAKQAEEEEDEDANSPYISPGIRNKKKKKKKPETKAVEENTQADSAPHTIIQYGPAPSVAPVTSVVTDTALASAAVVATTESAVGAMVENVAGAIAESAVGAVSAVAESTVGAMAEHAVNATTENVSEANAEEVLSQADGVHQTHTHSETEPEAAWENQTTSPQHERLSAEYQQLVAGVHSEGSSSISSLMANSMANAESEEETITHETTQERGPSTVIISSDSSANKEHVDQFTSSFDPYNPASRQDPTSRSHEQEELNGATEVEVESSEHISTVTKHASAVIDFSQQESAYAQQHESALAGEGASHVSNFAQTSQQHSVGQSKTSQHELYMGQEAEAAFTVSQHQDAIAESTAAESEYADADSAYAESTYASAQDAGFEEESATTTIISRAEMVSPSGQELEHDASLGHTAIYRTPEPQINMEDESDSFYKYAVTENNVEVVRQAEQAKASVRPLRTNNFSFTEMAREEEERARREEAQHLEQANLAAQSLASQGGLSQDLAQAGLEQANLGQEGLRQESFRQEGLSQDGLGQANFTAPNGSALNPATESNQVVLSAQVGVTDSVTESNQVHSAERYAPHTAPSVDMTGLSAESQSESAYSPSALEPRALTPRQAGKRENIISFTNFSNADEPSYEVDSLTSAFIPMDEGIVSGNTHSDADELARRKAQIEAQAKAQAEAQAKAQAEREEAERKEREEAEALAKAQAEAEQQSLMQQMAQAQNSANMQYMQLPNGQYVPVQGMVYQNMSMPMNGMQYMQMMANNNMLYQQQMLQAQAMQQAQLQQQLAQQQAQLQQQLAQQNYALSGTNAQTNFAMSGSNQQTMPMGMSQEVTQANNVASMQANHTATAQANNVAAAPSSTPQLAQGVSQQGAVESVSTEQGSASLEQSNTASAHTMGEHGASGNGLPTAGNAFLGAHNSSSSNLPSYMAGVSQGASFNQPRSLSLCSVPRHKFDAWRPSLDLLAVSHDQVEITEDELVKTSERINEVLHSYGVKASVADYLTGPVITRFDLDLAPGVKSSAISSIEKELCRNLLVPNVRVVPIIEGSSYVGLEVPNAKRQFITLGDMASSRDFQESKASLPMMLGASVVGKPVIKDLAETPHLLVAGTTGSGKSAGLNTMLISLLLKRSPAELRLILVDPKQLEFSIYKDLPHLITPVITDVAEKTAIALSWCVDEMERRFKLMSLLGVRKLSEYNDLVKSEQAKGSFIPDPLWTAEMGPQPQPLEPLPWIVVVVEEFADLMAQSARKKDKDKTPEGYIARLTAKSRAAGIHLVLVTQTPRSEVVNGMIKANIPSRIAFTVQNRLDSSIVLDEKGAECLLGNGDMLYKFSGSNTATRAHGSFTSNDDVKAVVNAWREKAAPEYLEDVITVPVEDEPEVEADADSAEQKLDVKFDRAAEIAREYLERRNKPPSITDLQNDLGVGFPRAKKIYKQLIKEGILED